MEAYYKYLNTISLLLTLLSLALIVIFRETKIYFYCSGEPVVWQSGFWLPVVLTITSHGRNCEGISQIPSFEHCYVWDQDGSTSAPLPGGRLQEYEFWENIRVLSIGILFGKVELKIPPPLREMLSNCCSQTFFGPPTSKQWQEDFYELWKLGLNSDFFPTSSQNFNLFILTYVLTFGSLPLLSIVDLTSSVSSWQMFLTLPARPAYSLLPGCWPFSVLLKQSECALAETCLHSV